MKLSYVRWFMRRMRHIETNESCKRRQWSVRLSSPYITKTKLWIIFGLKFGFAIFVSGHRINNGNGIFASLNFLTCSSNHNIRALTLTLFDFGCRQETTSIILFHLLSVPQFVKCGQDTRRSSIIFLCFCLVQKMRRSWRSLILRSRFNVSWIKWSQCSFVRRWWRRLVMTITYVCSQKSLNGC